MIGARIGATIGARIGPNVGDGTGGGGGIPGVTRDASSNIYAPANATEWTALMAAAGLATGNPASTWTCQEASGNLADAIGAVPLTQTGAGHLYQQAVAGWTRKAVQCVDGTAGQKWLNTTTAPNPGTTDVLLLAYVAVPVASPAAVRDVCGHAAAADCRFNTTGRLRAIFGASADLVNDPRGRVMPVLVKIDNTGSISAIYTDQEKFIGTYATPASASMVYLGGQTAAASGAAYLYAAEFTGGAARLSDAQAKTLLQTLAWTIPWS